MTLELILIHPQIRWVEKTNGDVCGKICWTVLIGEQAEAVLRELVGRQVLVPPARYALHAARIGEETGWISSVGLTGLGVPTTKEVKK